MFDDVLRFQTDASNKRNPPIQVSELGAESTEAGQLCTLVVDALEDRKAHDIQMLDVRGISNFTDFMVLASGTSNRHVKALVDHVLHATGEQGTAALGVEGRETNEWVLVDLGDVVVHVMQPDAREFYALERLWAPLPGAARRDAAGVRDGDRGAG